MRKVYSEYFAFRDVFCEILAKCEIQKVYNRPKSQCTKMILFNICLSPMRKYILQILRLDIHLLINYKLLKITIFPFKSTVFTFLIPTTLALLQSCRVPITNCAKFVGVFQNILHDLHEFLSSYIPNFFSLQCLLGWLQNFNIFEKYVTEKAKFSVVPKIYRVYSQYPHAWFLASLHFLFC